MSLLLQEYRRRLFVPVACAGLAVFYLSVFMPLGKRAADLDAPLTRAWRGLAASIGQTNAVAIDFQLITNQLNQTRHALTIVDAAHGKASEQLELPAELQARMNAPFQLFDYENERSKAAEAWTTLAKAQKVAVEPVVYSGFPEHTIDVRQPELLWPALSMINAMVTCAINAKVTALHSLEVPVVLTNTPLTSPSMVLNEIPLQLEFTGAVTNVARFLQALPLRQKEITSSGLPAATPEKTPLFIDRLIIKKQNPEKPDEVRVWLRVVGFVLRE